MILVPSEDVIECARILSLGRLRKARSQCLVIAQAVAAGDRGKRPNRVAQIAPWFGYLEALIVVGTLYALEMERRGFFDDIKDRLASLVDPTRQIRISAVLVFVREGRMTIQEAARTASIAWPDWWGGPVHAEHAEHAKLSGSGR